MLDDNTLAAALRAKILSMAELKQRFGVNQSTLSRALGRLEARRQVLQFGKARATRYAHVRSSPLLPEASLPIYEIDENGEAEPWGSITAVMPQGYVAVARRVSPLLPGGYFAGLPFYLQSVRPEGFLGRLQARSAALQLSVLPRELQLWSDEAVLHFASVFGEDLPGAFVVGEPAITRFLENKPKPVSECDMTALELLARQTEKGEAPGSSAGGERPKFTGFLQNAQGRAYHAIVKYSAAGDNPVEQRWRDLLVAEHLALEILRQAGLCASPSRLLCSPAGRVFLVVERYDRIGARGRRHYFSLAAVDHALIGDFTHIRRSLYWLWENKLLLRKHYEEMALVSLFGDLIGNTDQHFGNVSLGIHGGAGGKIFSLTPAYDVLPMWYAPRSNGSLPEGRHNVPVILPEYREFTGKVRQLARDFWAQVSQDQRISADFRAVAEDNLSELKLL